MTDEPMVERLEQCQVSVHDGGRFVGFHPCPNKAKGHMDDGTVACGVHIAAERRRKENRAAEQAERDAKRSVKEQAESRCRQLAPYLPDDSARPHYRNSFTSKPGTYSGGVTISAEDTDALLSQLREQRERRLTENMETANTMADLVVGAQAANRRAAAAERTVREQRERAERAEAVRDDYRTRHGEQAATIRRMITESHAAERTIREQRERSHPKGRDCARTDEVLETYRRRAIAAERTIREQREALRWIAEYDPRWTGQHVNDAPSRAQIIARAFDALAALAPDTEEPEATMPRVGGKPFRCDCGGNVFSRTGTRYVCNSCGTEYEGTPLVPDAEEGE